MTLLLPLGLLALASLPVLIWLWRHAASSHQTRVSSLVPFAKLLRRPPSRRTRLYVNLLFWLQAAICAIAALALAEPAWTQRWMTTTLVVIDTSASMAARSTGSSAFQRAVRELTRRVNRLGLRERILIVRTSPVGALTHAPTNDAGQLLPLLRDLRPVDESGNLTTAYRIGRALLGEPPDHLLVLTDEPVLASVPHVRSFDVPSPNVAIVGVDAYEPLCLPLSMPARRDTADAAALVEASASQEEARIVVTIQNFSDAPQTASVSLDHEGRRIARAEPRLEPSEKVPVSFDVPRAATGRFDVAVQAPRDALEVDNHVWLTIRGQTTIPIVVDVEDAPLQGVVGEWLDACPRLSWQRRAPDLRPPAGALLVTDRWSQADAWSSSSIVLAPRPQAPKAFALHWVAAGTHPIGMYLEPLRRVATPVSQPLLLAFSNEASPIEGGVGEPVLWGIGAGRKVPLVSVMTRSDRRIARLWFDPAGASRQVPLVVTFFNSLRWALGAQGFVVTGEPLLVGPFAPGLVRVETPRGAQWRSHDGGFLRYDATSDAGRYRLSQGNTAIERMVNFLDPVESNTMSRISTWEPDAFAADGMASSTAGRRVSSADSSSHASLAGACLWIVLLIFIVEWIVYARRQRR